ncbi:myo-inosose-2 dehydratase [Martelella mediterranea]|uniref:myo-inosose-2 dehydratase n=1 Tax=Martelella mediterranea TaxID=293089 RepID=UPI001E504FB0|nr:myo-inosose-2 dehydratase [Martelella mediterranea]MCD1636380.1 myo-inosose-2 dehydratase [Martelella mediterranea]
MSNNAAARTALRSIRLGVSPLSWVNEVLEDLGRDVSADAILAEARAAGFSGVEMSRAFPEDADDLAALLSARGLEFVSGWYSGFLAERSVTEELEAVREHADRLKALGAAVMVYGECGHMADEALDVPLSARLTLTAEDMAAYGARLTEFAEKLRDEWGLVLVYHHHLMMVAESLNEVCAVMDNTGPAVSLLLDTGHAYAGGFDYALLLDKYAQRIRHIHLKDVRADVMQQVRAEGISFNDGVRMGMFSIPGDGAVDFDPLARFLASGVYDGWLVVEAEQDPAKAPPAETASRAFRFVSDTILNRETV